MCVGVCACVCVCVREREREKPHRRRKRIIDIFGYLLLDAYYQMKSCIILTGAFPTPLSSFHTELGSSLFSSRPRNSVFTNPGDMD